MVNVVDVVDIPMVVTGCASSVVPGGCGHVAGSVAVSQAYPMKGIAFNKREPLLRGLLKIRLSLGVTHVSPLFGEYPACEHTVRYVYMIMRARKGTY